MAPLLCSNLQQLSHKCGQLSAQAMKGDLQAAPAIMGEQSYDSPWASKLIIHHE